MANDVINQTAFTDRILQVEEDPTNDFLDLKDVESVHLVSFDAAIQKLYPFIDSLAEYVRIAKEAAAANDQLTIDESTAIHLYTMGTNENEQPFYKYLNNALRSTDYEKQKAYFPFLKLFITALTKLESVRLDLARGAKMDLSGNYSVGKTFTWSTFSSCTPSGKAVFTNSITGPRTMFRIHCLTARNLQSFSHEDEYILLPGTQFKVISMLSPSTDFHVIEIEETHSSTLIRQRSSSISKSNKSLALTENISDKNTSSIQMTSKELEHINEMLDQQRENTEATFSLKSINDDYAGIIGTELKTNTAWIRLDLRSNKINDLGLTNLAAALVLNTTLTNLILEDNFIADYGIRLLADALKQNSTLESLTLTHNEIRESGAKYLAELLCTNTTLKELYLDENLIRSKGMNVICNILEQNNRTLKKFSVKRNNIKNDSFDAIIGVYAMNFVLEEFEYSRNDFSDDIQVKFDQAKKNREQRLEILNQIQPAIVFYLEWKNQPDKHLSREASLIFTNFHRLIDPNGLKTIVNQYQTQSSKQYLILSCNDKASCEIISMYCRRNQLNLLILQTNSQNPKIFNSEDALIYRLVTQIANHYRTCADSALQKEDKRIARIYREESIAFQQKLVDYMKKRRDLLVTKINN